jgi:hypothetical protein
MLGTTRVTVVSVLLILYLDCLTSQWLSKEAAEWAIKEFEKLENIRELTRFKGTDRRASSPFISGDGFREYCYPHLCEDTNRCKIDPLAVKDGQCVFVKSDMFEYFAKNVISLIPGKYIIVAHNGDLSVPDGQNDAPRIGMSKYITSDLLLKEYERGRLLALHTGNLWWRNYSSSARPAYAHCIPIG